MRKKNIEKDFLHLVNKLYQLMNAYIQTCQPREKKNYFNQLRNYVESFPPITINRHSPIRFKKHFIPYFKTNNIIKTDERLYVIRLTLFFAITKLFNTYPNRTINPKRKAAYLAALTKQHAKLTINTPASSSEQDELAPLAFQVLTFTYLASHAEDFILRFFSALCAIATTFFVGREIDAQPHETIIALHPKKIDITEKIDYEPSNSTFFQAIKYPSDFESPNPFSVLFQNELCT